MTENLRSNRTSEISKPRFVTKYVTKLVSGLEDLPNVRSPKFNLEIKLLRKFAEIIVHLPYPDRFRASTLLDELRPGNQQVIQLAYDLLNEADVKRKENKS